MLIILQARSGRQSINPLPSHQPKSPLSKSSTTPSPTRRLRASTSTRASVRKGGAASSAIALEDNDQSGPEKLSTHNGSDFLSTKRTLNGTMPRSLRQNESKNATAVPRKMSASSLQVSKRRPERRKEERKASVRKETYEIDETESEGEDDAINAQGNSDIESVSESESIMAAKLKEAGDGESLLGSAASGDEWAGDTEEEERFIIRDTARQDAKAFARKHVSQKGRGVRHGSEQGNNASPKRYTIANDGDVGGNGDAEDEIEEMDAYKKGREDSGSLSPETWHQLGLGGIEDELFAPQEGFHSSSEPSFTDFFGSEAEESDSADCLSALGVTLEAREDDNELTADNSDESETDISDLEGGLLSAPFLAAGVSTQVGPGQEDEAPMALTTSGQDVPLLVIEDLDGRLIYARAGDGEAVFGSDGEFEFVDDSDESETDEDMDGFANDGRWAYWRQGASLADAQACMSDSDEGDTTDELPNEDMPFPRLLVGSVAPHGGRNARRARAMAARSRKLSPAGRRRSQSREMSTASTPKFSSTRDDFSPSVPTKELDLSISTEALARDPKGTLELAAKSLGLTPNEVAQLVAGIQNEGNLEGLPRPSSGERDGEASVRSDVLGQQLSASSSNTVAQPMMRSGIVTPSSKPRMGSFIPTSSKSIHRAVIDGSRQAPSPFANRNRSQRKGTSSRKRHPSTSTPGFAKRPRRFSQFSESVTALGSQRDDTTDVQSSPELSAVDPMELDDVLDADVLLRGEFSSSPTGDDLARTPSKSSKSPMLRASKRVPNEQASKDTGLNLNAVARWHRIPMGAFRDGQGANSNGHRPLGTFLLTRSGQSSRSNGTSKGRKQQDHSPFRERGRADSVHFGAVPQYHGQSSNGSSLDATLANGGSSSRAREAFFVSPVLWPSRHGSSNTSTPNAGPIEAAPWINSGISPGNIATEKQSSRRMVTRREKRERKARKSALRAAAASAEGKRKSREIGAELFRSPIASRTSKHASKETTASTDSPATALPRLSITDASPRASPTPQKGPTEKQGEVTKLANITPVLHPVHGSNESQQTTSPSNDSHSSPHLQQYQNLPSSVFGVPLHSPLFGSVLQPNNLGFHDDLDERDAEGTLMI